METSRRLLYYRGPLAERRDSTVRPARGMAAETSKSVELETRIARLESITKGLQQELALRQRREVAIQAELDHLLARIKMVGGV